MAGPQPLAAGSFVGAGQYRVLRTAAIDGYGIWYEGEDQRRSTPVRLREYFPRHLVERHGSGAMHEAQEANRATVAPCLHTFVIEMGTLARLTHAALDRPVAIVEDNATAYAVFEPLAGPNLASWARGLARPLRQAEIDGIVASMLSALALVHRAGLCHFAIEPETVIVHDVRGPVLGGFGGAGYALLCAQGALPEAVRSGFSAPELCQVDARAVGRPADIFGLAATIQAILTGQSPPHAATLSADNWLPVPISPPGPDFRPDFLQALATALAPDPAQRPPSVQALSILLLDAPLPSQRPGETTIAPGGAARPSLKVPQPTPLPTSIGKSPPAEPRAVAPSAAAPAGRRAIVTRTLIAGLAALVLGGLYVLDFPLPRIPDPTSSKPGAKEPRQTRPPQPQATQQPALPPSSETAKAEQEASAKADEAARARILGDISRTTDRDTLLEIAIRHPAHLAAVEKRLSTLGFVKLAQKHGALWLMPGAGQVFSDCAECPEMVLLPAGQFHMGSPAAEDGRAEDEDDTPGSGGAPVDAVIQRPFAVGRFQVTRGEFAAFVNATSHKAEGGCYQRQGARALDTALSWRSPGFAQDDRHPVTCVSHQDARAFMEWLSERTGQTYRLLSEAEREFAARAAATSDTRFSFGNDAAELCRHANGADLTAKAGNPGWETADCRDGFLHTAPVGSFRPNGAGLYDMHGNLWEWVADCASGDLKAAARGTHIDCGGDDPRVLRGGSWSDPPWRLRSAARIAASPATRDQIAGFRVARSIRF